ncbi:kynureninase [Actinomadura chibensis]|uniref:Kynureninase n=1 Tax=Actinomadura chibensis TaxID=392828 RepID=A0A5D0NQ76_9ACTN|nr:kynureninase [Actinomadura chibensis]TYB46405.1 kynureninase [Actinomadura chibensis]
MKSLDAKAEELDAKSPFTHVRERFRRPDGTVYMGGHSLGALSSNVPAALEKAVLQEWGQGVVRSWIDWMPVLSALGERVGSLLGAAPGCTAVGDSTSVQLFNALTAAARLRPDRPVLLTDPGHFPTDRYLADSVARLLGLRVHRVAVPDAAEFLRAHGDEVGVAAYPAVDYRTGELWDLPKLTAMAHGAGALTVWDVSHAVGAMPLDLARHDVDFAVGCTYKYLSGGPGAPAFVYAAPRHQEFLDQPLTGWLGHAEPFSGEEAYRPAPGIERTRIGTPPMLSALALNAALDVYDDVELFEVRSESLSLTSFLIDCADELLAGRGFEVVTPRQENQRGSHVALRHPDAYPLVRALIERGVIGDMREPDLVRFGCNALYVTHEDVYRCVVTLRDVVDAGEHRDPRFRLRKAFG